MPKLLLGHGVVYSGGKAWAGADLGWLEGQHFDLAATQTAFDEGLDHVISTIRRRDRLDEWISQITADSSWTLIIRRLGWLRGISDLTGLGLAVEIGDWNRFTGNSLGACVGLVPSECSSGASRAQGPIIKTGRTCRRLLVEAAWHHQHRYVAGKAMRGRWDLASPEVWARGDAGNRRGTSSRPVTSVPVWPTSLSFGNWRAGAGPTVLTRTCSLNKTTLHIRCISPASCERLR
ncbi:transposase [Propionibacterium sp.]|uniref:transposase n=1 Tax=Propionibacterium sp. TaxID=1977903 RepID=UPI0039E97B6B